MSSVPGLESFRSGAYTVQRAVFGEHYIARRRGRAGCRERGVVARLRGAPSKGGAIEATRTRAGGMEVKRRNARILVALAAAYLAGSCGGESPSNPTRPSSPPPSSSGRTVEIVSIIMQPPGGGALTTGYTKQLTATARLSSGNYMNCTALAKWTSSDPGVATVSPDGVMRGTAVGDVTITANCDGTIGTLSTRVYQSVTLSGSIKDERGALLAGASIWARDSKFGHSTKSDSSGRYRIDGLPSGIRAPVSVNLDGYEAAQTDVTLADMTLDFTLRFQGFSVSGRTSEPALGPLGRVKVEVISGTNAGASTISPSWGTYGLQHLLPGTFTLRASKAGYDSIERTITPASRPQSTSN
jgi:hypothetical protein